jgi:hypothetical protein
MEEFQAEDRHSPLPHIALSATALKSAYRNTASLSTHTATELRELLIPVAGNGGPRAFLLRLGMRRDCVKCGIAQSGCIQAG